jgi:hypothetical protein
VTAISPLAILPIFALSARSFSFPAASYIAKSVPLTHIGFGLAVFTIMQLNVTLFKYTNEILGV